MSGSDVEELKGSGSRHEELAWPWLLASPPAFARVCKSQPGTLHIDNSPEPEPLLRSRWATGDAFSPLKTRLSVSRLPYLSDHLRPQAPLLVHI